MDSFFIDYRDPLLSVMVFFLIVFIVSLSTMFWNSIEKRKKESSIKKFAKRFEHSGLDDEAFWALNIEKNCVDRVAFLASIYERSGEFERAIKIYLSILEHLKNPKEKSEIMERLGKSYFQAGFLHRSRDIFLEVLKNFPRNKETLKNLLLVYESLKEFKRALEIIEPLEELGVDVSTERRYFECKSVINDPFLTNSQRCEKLCTILEEDISLLRPVAIYLSQNCQSLFWSISSKLDFSKAIDILWQIPKEKIDKKTINRSEFFMQIYSAKGYIDDYKEHSNIFEIETLKAINRCGVKNGDLDFEFICNECKNIFPLSFDRCPNCHMLLKNEALPTLRRIKCEENNSLL